MFELAMLPARQGDAIWIRWGDVSDPHHILIDMGTEETGAQMRQRLEALPETKRIIDLLVITHVDSDHIGGVLTCLAEADPLPGLTIDDVWFNGFQHLNGGSVSQTEEALPSDVEVMGAAQGERLSSWLREQHWNKAFKGAPVQRIPDQPPQTVTFFDDLKLTVLGPTPVRLNNLVDIWVDEVHEALKKGQLNEVSPGLETMGPQKPLLEEKEELELLAETDTTPDSKESNGSSIIILLEYKGMKVLLAGDAFADDVIAGIKAANNGQRLTLKAFKLPHHCSMRNNVQSLVEAVDCDYWLISTDGTQHHHPDVVALARVIAYSKLRTPKLLFNVPSIYNGWWNNAEWRARYDYTTQYGTKENGLTVQL